MFQRTVFNDEQNYFRETVTKFVSKEVLPHHSLWEKEGIVPKEIWLKAGDLGILCPNIPKEYGGIGGDFRFNVIVIEELAKIGASGPGFAVHSDIVAPYLINYSSDTQKKRVFAKNGKRRNYYSNSYDRTWNWSGSSKYKNKGNC